MQTIEEFIRAARQEGVNKWKPQVLQGRVPPIRGMARLTREVRDLALAECQRRNLSPDETQRALEINIVDRTIGDIDVRGFREHGFEDLPELLGITIPGESEGGGKQYRHVRKRMEEIELELYRKHGLDLRVYDIYGVGNPILRQNIIEYMQDAYGLTYPLEQVFVSTGAINAMDRTIRMLRKYFSNQGKPCVFAFPTPGWAVAKWQAEISDLPICLIETAEKADYKLTPEQLRLVLASQPDLRVLYLTITNNPTAYSYSPGELTALFNVIKSERPELCILADCAYIGTGDPEADQARLLTLRDSSVFAQTIVISSMSKLMTLTGDRFGWVSYGSRAIAEVMSLGWNNFSAGLPREWQLSFMAHLELYRSRPDLARKIRELYTLRRKRLIADLEKLNQTHPLFEQIGRDEGGGIYNWSKFKSGQDVFTLFEQTGIAGVPGSAFGYHDRFVRFSIGIVSSQP